MRTRSTLNHAAEQVTEGAVDAAELVVDTLTEAASDAVDLVTDTVAGVVSNGGPPIAAASITRLFKRPKTLVGLLIVAALGAWAYKRFFDTDDSTDDAMHGAIRDALNR